MKKEDLKVGQIVYKEECWTHRIFRAAVTKIYDDSVDLKGLDFVKPDGSPIKSETHGGTTGGKLEDIYPTAKEAYAAKRKKESDKIDRFCSDIKSMKDLLKFPLSHSFNAEEYTDYEAMEAYKIMCKKIAGIDVEKEEPAEEVIEEQLL